MVGRHRRNQSGNTTGRGKKRDLKGQGKAAEFRSSSYDAFVFTRSPPMYFLIVTAAPVPLVLASYY